MKKAKKGTAKATSTQEVETVAKKRKATSAAKTTPAKSAENAKPVAVADTQPPKVGDQNLSTESEFTNPAHPRLSDYRYYALLDNKNRIVGRGFLARVDKDPRRTWFALRNDEQTALWEASKWAIKEIGFERYQQLTREYLKAEGWPEFKAVPKATAAASTISPA